MKKANLDLKTATKLVSDFHTALAVSNDTGTSAKQDFQVATRKLLYDTLGKAYGTSLQLTADPVVLGQVCAHYMVKPPAAGENPHSACVRMFWRKKVDGKMVPDKSAWKYGKSFRAAQALGWTAENFAANLEEYKFEVKKDGKTKTLKGLIALETYDTEMHGNPEAQFSEQENRAAQAWLAKVRPALGSFAGDLVEAPKDQQMASVIVQFDAQTGTWQVRAVNQADHDRAWAAIAKPTLKAFDEWRKDVAVKQAAANPGTLSPEGDALFEALAAHNSDMDSRNALATWSNRLVGFETDGDFMWPTSSRDTPSVTSSDDQDLSASA